MEPIISRASIARMADQAASSWAANPATPKPRCPFDAHMRPEAAKAWNSSFERQLLWQPSLKARP